MYDRLKTHTLIFAQRKSSISTYMTLIPKSRTQIEPFTVRTGGFRVESRKPKVVQTEHVPPPEDGEEEALRESRSVPMAFGYFPSPVQRRSTTRFRRFFIHSTTLPQKNNQIFRLESVQTPEISVQICRRRLEEKARLYDSKTSEIWTEDNEDALVDFNRKRKLEQKHKEDMVESDSESDGEW